jgi:O-methyltransferase
MRERRLAVRINNSWLGYLAKRLVSRFEFAIMAHYKKEGAATVMRLLREVWAEDAGLVLFSPHELFMVYSIARCQRDHGGAFVEVGVFRGASLTVIAAAKSPGTKLFGFDTFEGLPSVGDDDTLFEKGMFKADETNLLKRVSVHKNVKVVKGTFPDTAAVLTGEQLSFVHLDVDTYESTIASLKTVYPMLLPGGIILSHDYSQAAGVHRAVGEFFQDRRGDRLIELSVSQVMIIKA